MYAIRSYYEKDVGEVDDGRIGDALLAEERDAQRDAEVAGIAGIADERGDRGDGALFDVGEEHPGEEHRHGDEGEGDAHVEQRRLQQRSYNFV